MPVKNNDVLVLFTIETFPMVLENTIKLVLLIGLELSRKVLLIESPKDDIFNTLSISSKSSIELCPVILIPIAVRLDHVTWLSASTTNMFPCVLSVTFHSNID